MNPALIMSIIGALGSLYSGMNAGKGGQSDKYTKLPTMTGEQNQGLSQLMQMLGPQGMAGQGNMQGNEYMQGMLDPSSEAYKKFEQPYMDQFNQETVPGLAERFAGMGGGMGGGMSSSGFGQALSSAGGNLQSQLAGLKTGMQGQAANSLMQQFQSLFGQGLGAQSFGYAHRPASASQSSQMFGPFMQMLSSGLGSMGGK